MGFKKPVVLIKLYQHLATAFGGAEIELSETKQNAVMLLSPNYGNVGDLAIGAAQRRYLERLGDLNVVSIPIQKTYSSLRSLKRSLRSGDLVFWVGGGSMGDLYPRASYARQFTARYFQDQPIISFPHSIVSSVESNLEAVARAELDRIPSKNVVLCARESISFELMNRFHGGDVLFAPDIVFSLIDEFRSLAELPRSGVLAVLRNDDEVVLTDSSRREILKACAAVGEVKEQDHGLPDGEVRDMDHGDLLKKFVGDYRKAELVVTDRLHGMIFSVITGTPCIVLPNSNHKIAQTYKDWVEDECRYISLLDQFELNEFNDRVSAVRSKEARADYSTANFDFTELTRFIESRIK